MAISWDDFDKIWASTSPLTPYSFSDNNYKQGWNFVGATPPARQMWDSIQKQNDEKLKYIVDNFLPLSGGTMTGEIIRNTYVVKNNVDNGYTEYLGGKDETSSYLVLYGKSHPNAPGLINIRANNGTNNSYLTLDPNGSATWGGKEIERVNASGSNYTRYESGVQICWGNTQNITSSGTYTINFPVAFSTTTYIIATIGRWWATSSTENYYLHDTTTTTIKLTTIGSVGSGGHQYHYIAIGRWK